MGFVRHGPISLIMKQFYKIHYGLEVMHGGTPTVVVCSDSGVGCFGSNKFGAFSRIVGKSRFDELASWFSVLPLWI